MLSVQNVHKKLGQTNVLTNVSFEVTPGEIFGFLGPNGAGKTTTIRIITGLMPATHGSVTVDGFDVSTDRQEALSRIGAIVENPAFYPYLTGRENLIHAKNLIPNLKKVDLNALGALVGLESKLDMKVKQYSLGMKQRLGIARALLHNPKVLILDEPTNGLDPAGIADLRNYLRHLAEHRGIAILISSHLLSEMELITDRFAIIDHGQIKSVQDGTTREEGVILCKVSREQMNEALDAAAMLFDDVKIVQQSAETFLVPRPETDIPVLLKRLINQDINVFQIGMKYETLEDQFLKVTKKEGGTNNAFITSQ
ncbi:MULTISPECIES: ABC transporter ATP-binding protein [unclassified Exiguobacterium]|uniref:ABC transporter ATP-binding protein n=1 Tax=unclassified Exiguobacterium TaxID=2644629 RepID=UPI00103DE923|nr:MULTISPECIES: ABC transporter ATP-binding protein [unclassified Exiguobacterium]TCI37678.1 ABC transporter ATP-binding protein [Exiguobacterium sp. SH4S7]TCI46012.1 ABC transporter ATP-binding protein [Exiguobacterium sp. SH5S32]TCI51769.1 ABC transporter ATP-binding protein [Exiguobacterium sp. SH1S4]TCI65786.1 ABC transporter ATP-binding protein [Exiguobacterium sp. SH0S2]TCI71755.1 ABC transporter ATP-binding protein [Exiguobacterium sp. SH1S1]